MAQDQKLNDVFNLIKTEMESLINDNPTFYYGYTVELTSELLYARKITFKPKTIYIVVRFLRSTMYYDQLSIPVSLSVLAEQNSFDVARTLIMDFVTTYNLTRDEATGNILQKFETPVVMSNFNDFGNGFRTLFSVGCGFLISDNNNPLKTIEYFWNNGQGQQTETFKPLNSSYELVNQLDSQGFFSSKNLTTSVAQVFSFSVSFQTYRFLNSHLFKTALSMINGNDSCENDTNYDYNNTTYHLKITFKDGSIIEKDMKLVRMGGAQPVDGLPTDNWTFAC